MSQKNIRVAEDPEMSMSEINRIYCGKSAPNHLNRMDNFVQALSKKSDEIGNVILTENGALTYASSGSALVDFNASATHLRHANETVILHFARQAYAEDALLAVKLFFQTGDIRGGKGERKIFLSCMDFLSENHPTVAMEVLSLIPEYTRWDYLVRLCVPKQATSASKMIAEKATQIVTEQFQKDLTAAHSAQKQGNAHVSLLAKWLPSLQTKKADQKALVRHLLKTLHMQERDYRHALSELRGLLNVIEKSMSKKDPDSIDMQKLTAKQQLRYRAFFQRALAQKRHEFIQAVLRGEATMNASVLNPVEILHDYAKNYQAYLHKAISFNEDLEALWSLLPDRMSGNGNTLVVRDGSGSMTFPIGTTSSATMLEAATAMAIYCAEKLSGPFKDKFITFSSKPRLVDMSHHKSLAKKINLLYGYDECSNTDIEATFDLILDCAVSEKLAQEDLPSYVLILSDMEFDMARSDYHWLIDDLDTPSRKTLFQTIRSKWEKAGYQVPTLVFWNLNGRRTTFPEIDAENGVIYLSGFSTNELSMVMAGEYEKLCEVTEEETVLDEVTGQKTIVQKTVQKKVILSPREQLVAKLSKERYDAVELAVKLGLAKEYEGSQTA